jgi:hypothetical protein
MNNLVVVLNFFKIEDILFIRMDIQIVFFGHQTDRKNSPAGGFGFESNK